MGKLFITFAVAALILSAGTVSAQDNKDRKNKLTTVPEDSSSVINQAERKIRK